MSAPLRLRVCIVVLLLCGVSFVVCDPAVRATHLPAGMPTELRLGWTGPTGKVNFDGKVNIDSIALGHPSLVGYLMAIQEANESTDWLPFTKLIGDWTDTNSDQSEAIAAAYGHAQNGAIAVIGDVQDLFVTQDVLKRFKIPQICPNSYAVEYTKYHRRFPYFMRNTYSAVLMAREAARMASALGYKRGALVYSNEPFATGPSGDFFEACREEGFDLPVSPNFVSGTQDWSLVISRLVAAKIKIIFFLGNPWDLQSLWRYAQTQTGVNNIVGDGYLWMFVYSLAIPVVTHDSATGAPLPDMQRASAGQVALLLNDDPTTPEFGNFFKRYRATPFNPNASSVVPSDPTKFPGYTAIFTYDATWQAIRGLHRMIHELEVNPLPLENRPLLYRTLLNTTFKGATGPIVMDEIGDRKTYFTVGNYKRATNTWERVGYLGPTAPGGKPKIDIFPGASFEWPGSDPTFKPLDAPPRKLTLLTPAVKDGLLAVCICILILCAVMQVIVILFRSHRVMKASSPLFLVLYLVGVQLLCASVIPRTYESDIAASPVPCEADLFLANIGYTLFVGALLIKTWRLKHIFNRKQLHSTVKLDDTRLLMALAGLLLLESALLVGLSVGAPMSIQLREVKELEDYYVCRTDSIGDNELSTIYLPAIMATRFALLIATTVVVYGVRNIPDTFSTSHITQDTSCTMVVHADWLPLTILLCPRLV
jgi:ABC-type branched-subunit amino acid transport system substrate-binding protein